MTATSAAVTPTSIHATPANEPATLSSPLGQRSPRASRPARATALGLLAGLAVTTAFSPSARAAGLNDPSCVPSPQRPYPAVVVHGQAGDFRGMTAITGALVQAGYCVYAKNYGFVPGGANGQDHLSTSADQIGAFVDQVLAQTKAQKVDVVGHSAGTGVLDDFILKKGGAAKVHRFVSFGGLHHPYAHAGVAKFLDAAVFLPNLTLAARKIDPNFSVQNVVKLALATYAAVGSPLGMVDPALAATASSNFTADLFDPVYWNDVHGGLEENEGTYVTVGADVRGKQTNDAAPNVCYTNIVAIADLLVSPETGFQDDATNVENLVLTSSVTTNAHVDMISDPNAIGMMLAGFNAPCAGTATKKPLAVGPSAPAGNGGQSANDSQTQAEAQDAFTSAVTDDLGSEYDLPASRQGSCSSSGAPARSPVAFGAGIALALAACLRRARRSAKG